MRQKTKQKYALYLDPEDLKKLREYQERVGVPVSESIRRAIAAYVETLKKK
jgi:Ribbon-helix-helix domain